jgi:hypothetical protein
MGEGGMLRVVRGNQPLNQRPVTYNQQRYNLGVQMSRVATGDTYEVRPQNNVYTGLAAAATIAVAIGVVVVFLQYRALFNQMPFGG